MRAETGGEKWRAAEECTLRSFPAVLSLPSPFLSLFPSGQVGPPPHLRARWSLSGPVPRCARNLSTRRRAERDVETPRVRYTIYALAITHNSAAVLAGREDTFARALSLYFLSSQTRTSCVSSKSHRRVGVSVYATVGLFGRGSRRDARRGEFQNFTMSHISRVTRIANHQVILATQYCDYDSVPPAERSSGISQPLGGKRKGGSLRSLIFEAGSLP